MTVVDILFITMMFAGFVLLRFGVPALLMWLIGSIYSHVAASHVQVSHTGSL